MANDNRPVFVYQSRLTNNDRAFATENVEVTKQADQSNTLGSVSTEMGRFQVQQNPGFGVGETVGRYIMGGTPTFKDALNDPTFACSIVDLAAEFENPQVGGLPACSGGKAVIAKKQGDSWIAECGCPSDTGGTDSRASADQIAKIQDAALDCQKQKRKDRFSELNIDSNIFRSEPGAPWEAYGEIYNQMLQTYLNMDLEPYEKGALIKDLLFQLNDVIMNDGWDSHPSYDQWINDAENEMFRMEQGVVAIQRDSSINVPPSENSIAMVLLGMSQQPEKNCGAYNANSYDNTSRSGRVLDENCNCICTPGEGAQQCPGTDHCIACENGTVMVVHPATFGLPPSPAYCTCECPEGKEFKNGECLQKCEPGFTLVETPCADPFPRKKCYKCACVENVGSWLFPKFVTHAGTCYEGFVEDPKNGCKCICAPGFDTYYDLADTSANREIRCKKCPKGQYYHWEEDMCKCSFSKNCPDNAEVSEASDCGCECVSPYVKRYIEAGDYDREFECICPPGTMLNNSGSACIPISSGWGDPAYTSLTPVELERIAKSYSISDDIKLL